MKFIKCNWQNNTAELGSAIDAFPDFYGILANGKLPELYFVDNSFEENFITEKYLKNNTGMQKGLGTFLATEYVIYFEGVTKFINNSGTGLYLLSGILNVKSNATLIFQENHAQKGGALALYGLSFIYLGSNTYVLFHKNRAEIKGGAIYVKSLDLHARFFSRICFLQSLNHKTNQQNENVTIIFSENEAQEGGNSIYASSLKPCVATCREDKVSSINLQCLAMISLNDSDIKTDLETFQIEMSNLNPVIPGKSFNIPIKATDELDQMTFVYYYASFENKNSSIQLDRSQYSSHSKLKVHSKGKVENKTLLLTYKQKIIAVNDTVQECPPGHVIDSTNECVCETSKFQGILACDRSNKTATIGHGYWIGLCEDKEQCTGYSTTGFCKDNAEIHLYKRVNETFELICSDNREGKLCGKCTDKHSVYYHSDSYRCGEESHCKYGIFFYILSEILPLTIIFISIIAFKISFTSGAVNGIILYAQIFQYFFYDWHVNVLKELTDFSTLIYSVSNLNFFNIEKLSFCLWKGFNTLDVIA